MDFDGKIYIYTDPGANKSSYWGRLENGYVYEGEMYGQGGLRYRLSEENHLGERFLYEGPSDKVLGYRIVQDKYDDDMYYFYEGFDFTHLAFVLRGDMIYKDKYGKDGFMFRLKQM